MIYIISVLQCKGCFLSENSIKNALQVICMAKSEKID